MEEQSIATRQDQTVLFSIIKHTDGEELKRQLPKVVSGVMVAVVALPLSSRWPSLRA